MGREAAELLPLKQCPLSIRVSGYRQQRLLRRGQVLIERGQQCRVSGVFRHQINQVHQVGLAEDFQGASVSFRSHDVLAEEFATEFDNDSLFFAQSRQAVCGRAQCQ